MSKPTDRIVLPDRIRPRLSFDPKSQPWRVSDAEFGVIPALSLQPSFVRDVLSASIDRPLSLPDERSFAASAVVSPPTEAAVLVPLVMREGGLTVLLTKRTDHLRDHAGQVSFPGGRVEAHDENPVATALRETFEETGLTSDHVDILGRLPRYFTGTGFAITPVTGFVTPRFTLVIDSFEVAQVFEVPLSHFTDHRNYRFHEATLPDGQIRRYYSVSWDEYFIWGATAAMLRGVYQVLAEAFSSSKRP